MSGPRPSTLLYAPARFVPGSDWDAGEVLFTGEDGIPLLWFLCFGARNTYTPGESLESAGGAAASRNRYETQVEDAQYRLEQAENNLRTEEHLWPWLSALPLLRRRLIARPRTGFLRLSAPWVPENRAEELRTAIAMVENAVNNFSHGRHVAGRQSLDKVAHFVPVLFSGDKGDAARFRNAKAYANVPVEALRVARLTLGTAGKDDATFIKQVDEYVAPALERLKSLPPPPEPEVPKPAVPAPVATTVEEREKSLLGKLTGLFRRK